VLSIVMTIVDGVVATRGCLKALASQEGAPPLEIVVPYDDSVRGMDALVAEFPDVRFVSMGRVETLRPASRPSGQHELFDRRRAAGLAAVTGDLVGILEDRGVPRPDWARRAVELHALPHAVIGGAVENGRDRLLNWAVYLCDFGRYQPPLTPGPRAYLTDVNICYKRGALEKTRHLWRDRYHETTVHWELLRSGETLFLAPELVVEQRRDHLRLFALLRERLDWGRLFAYTRAKELSRGRLLLLAALCPLLPFALFGRLAALQLRKRVALGAFLRAAPAVWLLMATWSAGEMLGYVTAKP